MENEFVFKTIREIKLEKALETIMNWELPETGAFWPAGNPISYSSFYGSEGERDYMKGIAREALK